MPKFRTPVSKTFQSLLVAATAATSLALAPDRAISGEIHGLVIGINDYVGERNDLQGAVNDAVDIAAALNKAGAQHVISLLDTDATKAAIEAAWNKLVAQASEGDTIIFSFAGHGSQEPEPEGRGEEADGKNENFLLAGFETEGEGTRERIIDDEIFDWLKQADQKGVRVVFIADSCHSGSMHRSARADTVRFRNGDFGVITQDMLEFPPPTAAKIKETDYANVTFVGATSEDRLTPEVTIEGKKRGALSWAIARALEGRADKNRDGEVTQVELLGFVVPAVHAMVESQQTPQVAPLRARSLPLFSVRSFEKKTEPKVEKQPEVVETVTETVETVVATPVKTDNPDNLRLALVGGDASLVGDHPGVTIVEDKSDADVIWYFDEGQFEHTVGGKVAENVTTENIAPIVSKWAALKWLRTQSAKDPVQAQLPKGNHRYKKGEIIEVNIGGARYPHLTLFNMPPDGRVEFFIPDPARPGEASKDWSAETISENFRVDKPPFGAEHMVAIFSKTPLSGLHAGLRSMGSTGEAGALLALLQQSLDGSEFQVGVLDIYTGAGR